MWIRSFKLKYNVKEGMCFCAMDVVGGGGRVCADKKSGDIQK